MAAKKGGLGRGLDALFADNSIEEIASTSAVKLKIMDIEPVSYTHLTLPTT